MKAQRNFWKKLGLAGMALGLVGLGNVASASDAVEEASAPAAAGVEEAFVLDYTDPALSAVGLEGVGMDEGLLEPLGQYARPYRVYGPSYRAYRPGWRVRVLPPVMAPGWFGVYFFGNPPPPPTTTYVTPPPVATPGYVAPAPAPAPIPAEVQKDFRHVNHFSIGLSAGAYISTYQPKGDNGYDRNADPGFRFSLKYRNAPALGAEVSVGMFGSNLRLDGEGAEQRRDVPIQVSAMVYFFPKFPIQPYLVLGGSANLRTYAKMYDNGTLGDPYKEVRAGVHGGLGVEMHVGPNVSFTAEGRRVLYTMIDHSVVDQTKSSDSILTGGMSFYF